MYRSFGKIFLLLVLANFDLFGQRFVPHTFMVGVEAPSILRSIISRERNMGELQLNLNVASHMVIFEYGFEDIDRRDSTFQYNTNGPYFRSGIDFTLNPKNPDGHQIFTGFRYGQANYDNKLSFDYASEAFDSPNLSVDNNVKGNWLEWTFGMKVVLKKNFVMGYTMRYKFSPGFSGNGTLSSFDLPGYGRGSKQTNFGFNYYLYYRLQFRKPKATKKPIPIEEEGANP